ncbi:MAG: sugar phosphate isomerase/epimerase [Desulfobacterales bacterium]|nr:MAG: sugar phosphate isomerase/epimerase [Desulfobacterales bacterium]
METPILISTAAYDGYDFAVAFKEIAELGADRVELAFIAGYTDPFTEDFFSEANARMLAGLLAEYQLACPSFSSHMDLSREPAVDIFKKRMDFARRVGARYIISNAGPRQRKRAFMRNMEALARWAEATDMIIALENPGDGQANIIDSARSGAGIIHAIGCEAVKLNYDFGNLISHCFEKVRPEEDYKYAAAVTAHYHLKDVAAHAGGWHFTEIGQGMIDYRQILTELAATPAPQPVSLEIPLRVSRAADASPRRAPAPVALEEIRRVLAGSLDFVKSLLSP